MALIAVVGTGYVGLTTGACLASLGHSVCCADVDETKVERLRKGEIPIVEEGLERLVAEGLASGRLTFVLGAEQAVLGAEFIFLCVPTPEGADGQADLSFVETAAQQIRELLICLSTQRRGLCIASACRRLLQLRRSALLKYCVPNPPGSFACTSAPASS